jgi:hypothetical protein
MKKNLLLIILSTCGIINSQNIFKNDFSNFITDSPLHSQNGWSHTNNPPAEFGIGNCVPIVTGGICSGSYVITSPIAYPDYGTSTNSIQIAGQLDNPGRGILPIISDGDLYVGLVLNISSAPGTSASDFLRINNGGNGSGISSEVAFRLLVQDATTGYKIGIRKGASANLTVYTNDIYNYDENVLVILKYSQLTGTNDDILNLYTNPSYASGEPTNPTSTTSSGFDQSGLIDRLVFRFALNTTGTMPTGKTGLISVARTWADLGFIPLSTTSFNSNNFTIIGNNASNGFLTIKCDEEITNASLNIYTITGAIIEKQTISLEKNANEIKINPITTTGLYIVEVIDNSGKKIIKKITIN